MRNESYAPIRNATSSVAVSPVTAFTVISTTYQSAFWTLIDPPTSIVGVCAWAGAAKQTRARKAPTSERRPPIATQITSSSVGSGSFSQVRWLAASP